VFVDEFQDTDPVQAEIMFLLAADSEGATTGSDQPADWRTVDLRPGALFVVGDPKQSIYRFRRADVGAYRQISDEFDAAGAVQVTLQTSFRSVPAIQRFVNTAFRPDMTGDRYSLQANYVPLATSRGEYSPMRWRRKFRAS